MLLLFLMFPLGSLLFIGILLFYSISLKKEKNIEVAEKNVTITPQLSASEVEDMYYRQQIARFLYARYRENMVDWQPDSWINLEFRSWFTCKIFLSNGLCEICKIWQKDKKPYKVEGIGASFNPTKTNPMISESEFEAEKEKKEFSLEEWLDLNTEHVLKLCMEAQENNQTSIIVPNDILPMTLECKKLVQKGLMQTSMLGGSEINEVGIYFQLL